MSDQTSMTPPEGAKPTSDLPNAGRETGVPPLSPGSVVLFAGTEYPVITELNGGFALIAHPNGPAICGHGWLSTLHQHDDDTARAKELARLATEKFIAWAWVRLKGQFYPPNKKGSQPDE